MTEPRTFSYETEIEWKGEREGLVHGPGLSDIGVGAAPEFKGREGVWTPEHLLVASVNSCFMLTLLAIAENSKLSLVSFSSTAKGKLEKVQGAGYQITEIVLAPKVVVASAEDIGRTTRILEKAKENCFVSNSIKSVLKLKPEVFHHQTQTSPCPPGEKLSSGRAPSRTEKGQP
jgi:organic hydroperoxide reductase OsmC/OhrA